MRIVSICPSNTEMLAFLNLDQQIVGIDDFSDWPPQVCSSLPRLGPDLQIDLDKLEQLKPDLVVASLSVPGMERNIIGLQERNIPHIVLNPQSLKEIGENLIVLGEATGTLKLAIQVKAEYESVIEQYREYARKIQQPIRLYWEWWPKPIFSPGGVNWLTEVSQLAGAENIFADREVASVQAEWSDIVAKNPEHIAMIWVGVQEKRMNPKHIKTREHAEQIIAVKQDSISVLEEALFCRPSLRIINGIQKLSALLHPSIYPNLQKEWWPSWKERYLS